MYIMVAGPYSAQTEIEKRENLTKLNKVAAQVAKMGHVPVVGVNAALPIVEAGDFDNPYQEMMRISLALAEKCDAIIYLALSEGVQRELEIFRHKGLPIYNDLSQITPSASSL